MTLLVRNESDIIRENLDFHLSQGVDHVFVTDNRSEDDTYEILTEYQQRNQVTLLYESGDNHAQGRWVTRMARLAVDVQKADWIINNDADEFWWPRKGTLKSTLEDISPRIGTLLIKRTNYLPSRDEDDKFYRRMLVRETNPVTALGNPLPPKVCHRGFDDVEVKDGNHDIATSYANHCINFDEIEILHYPLRTYRQFEKKIELGGAALERNGELPQNTGSNWRYLYRELQSDRLRAYYNSQILYGCTSASGESNRRLIRDHRLARYLERLYSQPGTPQP